MKKILMAVCVCFLLSAASNSEAKGLETCSQKQERVEVELENFKHLGNAKIDLLQKLLRLEEAILLIEDSQCKSVMHKYYPQLPALKKQKEELDKVFPN